MEHTKYLGINPYQIPVKVSPDHYQCKRCIDNAYLYDENGPGPDCGNCKLKNRLGYLIQTSTYFGKTYGIVVFENGKIGRVHLAQIEALDVPKLSINPLDEE